MPRFEVSGEWELLPAVRGDLSLPVGHPLNAVLCACLPDVPLCSQRSVQSHQAPV